MPRFRFRVSWVKRDPGAFILLFVLGFYQQYILLEKTNNYNNSNNDRFGNRHSLFSLSSETVGRQLRSFVSPSTPTSWNAFATTSTAIAAIDCRHRSYVASSAEQFVDVRLFVGWSSPRTGGQQLSRGIVFRRGCRTCPSEPWLQGRCRLDGPIVSSCRPPAHYIGGVAGRDDAQNGYSCDVFTTICQGCHGVLLSLGSGKVSYFELDRIFTGNIYGL